VLKRLGEFLHSRESTAILAEDALATSAMDLAHGLRLVFTSARRIKIETLDQMEEPQPSSNGTGDGLIWITCSVNSASGLRRLFTSWRMQRDRVSIADEILDEVRRKPGLTE